LTINNYSIKNIFAQLFNLFNIYDMQLSKNKTTDYPAGD